MVVGDGDTFDKGDWNWCPLWKGTQRQFECTKTIGSDRVIEAILNTHIWIENTQ